MSTYTVQILSVTIFGCVVCTFIYLPIRWFIDHKRGKEPKTRFEHWFRHRITGCVLYAILVAGLVCIADGFLIEPRMVTVTNYEIATSKIPAGKTLRIVHLADLHVRKQGPREKKLPEIVSGLEPDLILHSGDFFGHVEGDEDIVKELLKSWDVPQYACRGNMDDFADYAEALDGAGVVRLDEETVEIEVNGVPLTISGFPSGYEYSITKDLSELSDDIFNIVLYHHPQGFIRVHNTPADLMLAGHTHGGQVRLPFYGALITLDGFGKRWEYGRYDEEGATLIVSRGLGAEPSVPEIRFLCPPEVVVIDLIGEGEDSE